jgi:anthranilate synthase component 1
MPASDEFERFAEAYASGKGQIVRDVLVGDCETPVAAFLKLRAFAKGAAFLLESVEGGAVRGRYSMIGLQPDLVWRCDLGQVSVARPLAASPDFEALPDEAFTSLRGLIARSRLETGDIDLPMAAGLFGYLGYDMVRLMERLPARKATGIGLPDAILVRPTVMVIFDAVKDEISVVASVRPAAGISARAAHETARERIDAVVAALDAPLQLDAQLDVAGLPSPAGLSNTTPERYSAMVDAAKDYIRAGDIFQVVLSQRFDAPFSLPPFSLYRALRRVNPAPFLCYLDFEVFQIVCSSPEILVRLRDQTVTIRPIAGTRRRGSTPSEDEALAAELVADPKERSEHLMLLDLGRNDVGRVAKIGTDIITIKMVGPKDEVAAEKENLNRYAQSLKAAE